MQLRRLVAAALLLSLPTFHASAESTTALVNPALFSGMQWRDIGPYRGGRSDAVTGVPNGHGVFYFGAAAGGVWKTIDYGAHWKPIADDAHITSIGALAVAPSNPDVIYVGTGESALRGDITFGNGVYRTTDGGKTWQDLGLKDTRQIGAIIIDPHNPDIALVAAIGHAFGANDERGIYRTTNGGKSWTRVLYRDDKTAAIDITADPSSPKILYAALWQVLRQPWHFSSGGPGSGLFRSTDGGVTWTELKGNGLPDGILGRIDVAVSQADPKRIYAMIEAKAGGLYASNDHGEHWKLMSQDGRIRQRAWYFTKVYADPKSVDTVYVVNTGLMRSTDGGKTFDLVSATHGDHHAMWIDPTNDRHIIDGNDGGASISLDGGTTWSTQDNQPTAAFYHVATDDKFPYYVYGAQQDNTNLATASYSDDGTIGPRDWFPAGGGECGFVIPDPRDTQIIYSDSENSINRFNHRTEQSQDISAWPINVSGHAADDLKHRFNWTSPLMMSPHNPDVLYWASEVLWKSTDHGHSWHIISPDLTRNDKSKQTASGGPLTKDITSVEYYDTIFTVAESPQKPGKIWVGSDDGLVHLTEDDGANWSEITPSGLKPWSSIDMIDPSHHDANTAYMAVDRHKLDDIAPYAYKTTDNGQTWTSITNGLPNGAVVHAVREDPKKPGLLYAATELGVFVSFNDGANWQPLQLGMPISPVHDIVVHDNDLVAATHGRAFWILDDITPLRQINPEAQPQDATLYTPEQSIRLYYPDDVDTKGPTGENPPAGAMIDYYLKSAPKGELTVDILDDSGKLLRHMSSTKTDKEIQPPEWPDRIVETGLIPAKPGMNRLVWDLRINDPVQIPGAFYEDQPPRGPIVAPGHYTVKLTVNFITQSAPLTIVPDPRVGPDAQAAIDAKTALVVAVTQDIDSLHRAVNEIRKTRTDLQRIRSALGTCDAAKSLSGQADAILPKLDPIEQTLMQVDMKGSEADLAFPTELNEQYATFQLVLGDADTPPTDQQKTMFADLHRRLTTQLTAWQSLRTDTLGAFNTNLKQSTICPVDPGDGK